MKNLTVIITGLILATLTMLSCEKQDKEKDFPNCVERKIRKIKREEVRNPPASVWEWNVDGKTYYYITSLTPLLVFSL